MSTKADAVCLALTALWQADPDLDAVNVVDGPQATSEALNEWLFVSFDGADPSESADAVAGEQDWQAFAKTRSETAEITCAVVVRAGDADIPSVRARAYAILGAAEDALRADMTLSGLVLRSHVAAHQYIPVLTQGGCKARVVFTVAYLAQLS